MRFNWAPGIGDPTIGGWVTVALYLAATVNCLITALTFGRGSKERRIWSAISVLFLALSINKQLDLQTALTEIGRIVSDIQGWYPQRQTVQVSFIALIATLSIIAMIALLTWARGSPAATKFALLGTSLVIAYVLIRAASFHHIDRFIGNAILGLRWNWILEVSGISVVLFASQRRRHRKNDRTSP